MTGEEPQESTEETTDVSELIQNERVTAITNAREQVIDVVTRAREAYYMGQMPEEAKNLNIAQAVDAYIRELGYLLRNSDVGNEYWKEKPVGVWELEPPDPEVLAWKHKKKNDVGTSNLDSEDSIPKEYSLVNEGEYEAQTIAIQGLRKFLQIPRHHSVEHTAEFHIRFYGRETVTESSTEVIPAGISMQAFSLANDFAGKLGLDVEITEGLPSDELKL